MPRCVVPRLLLLLLFAACPLLAHGQDTALLLGVRYSERIPRPLPYYAGTGDSLSRPVYGTLYIAARNGKISATPRLSGLYVPRSDGFWRVDAKRSIYNDWVEDFVWAAPVGDSPQLNGIPSYNGEYCEGHRTQQINFASSDLLAVEVRSAGYCEDAAHPWNFNTFAVIPIDSADHLGVPLSRLFGSPGREALYAGADAAIGKLRAADREKYVSRPDEASWNIARGSGKWVVRGRLDPSVVTRSEVLDFDVDLKNLTPVTGRSGGGTTWDVVRAFAPGATDAFGSPTGDLVIIQQANTLTVHRVAEGKIQPSALTIPLPAGTRAVSARWAGGAEARRWSTQFPDLVRAVSGAKRIR